MRLEVETFAGGIGGDEDTDGMLLRIGIECLLDLFSFSDRRRAVIDLDPLIGAIRPLDGGFELLPQVSLGVVVFRKNDDASVIPTRAGLAEIRTHLPANPLDELSYPPIRPAAGIAGDSRHLLKQDLLLPEQFLASLVLERS